MFPPNGVCSQRAAEHSASSRLQYFSAVASLAEGAVRLERGCLPVAGKHCPLAPFGLKLASRVAVSFVLDICV